MCQLMKDIGSTNMQWIVRLPGHPVFRVGTMDKGVF